MLKLFYVFDGKKQSIDRASYKDRDTHASFLLRYLHNSIGAARIKEINTYAYESFYVKDGLGREKQFTVEALTDEGKNKLAELTNEWKQIRQEHDELEREKRENEKRRAEQYELEKMRGLVHAEIRKNEDGSWEVGE